MGYGEGDPLSLAVRVVGTVAFLDRRVLSKYKAEQTASDGLTNMVQAPEFNRGQYVSGDVSFHAFFFRQ